MVRSHILGGAFALATLVSSRCTTRAGDANTINAVTNSTFDYIIVGGGLTGLVVATRLTEDSNGK